MYDVIKCLLNLTHIEYYESLRNFINRFDTDKNGDLIESISNVSIIPLENSFIEFGSYNIPIDSIIDPRSEIGESIERCYNNCILNIPGINKFIILQDYGNTGIPVRGYNLNFIVGSVIPSSGISLLINSNGLYISYQFNNSLVVIKVSSYVVDTTDIFDKINSKRPFNTQFYLGKDNYVYLCIGISNVVKRINENTGILFSEISTPEFLNKMDSIKLINSSRTDSEYRYIELCDLLTNGFTNIYEDNSWVKECDDYGPDPNFIYLISSDKNGIKMGLKLDRYGTLYGVTILNPSSDFYPKELPS